MCVRMFTVHDLLILCAAWQLCVICVFLHRVCASADDSITAIKVAAVAAGDPNL